MDENDWSEEEREAWRVLHDARPGDYVLWADRSMAMKVAEVEQDDEGHHVLYAEKPRGEGTYEVHERYNHGKPKFTSPIGRANNLHFVERVEPPRALNEDEYEDLVERLTENAIDAFVRLDYGDWSDAVSEVVDAWAEDVAYRDWAGYKHYDDWQDGDTEAIFESVVEHAEDDGHAVPEGGDDQSLRSKARLVLYDAVYQNGSERAEASLITDPNEYRETVEKLAHHTLDRYDRKNYSDARVATRDTISQWVDERDDPALTSVTEFGNDRFDDEDYIEEENPERERAFDILDHEVWEEVQELQRDRGEHDPTLRGLTYADYRDLVDWLAGEAVARYDGEGLLRTTADNVVREWADSVEAEEWDGHRHRVYADGDVEDIFTSVAIHADNDPTVWNPFSSKKERKLAINALVPDVLKTAKNIIDERGEDAEWHEANEYLQNQLGMPDMTYDDLHAADRGELRDFLRRALDSAEGDEVGWTFVEEIVEAGGTIPESTNDWTLIDYGVVRENDRIRKLAWFDRETGALLILSGLAEQDDELGISTWSEDTNFHVQRVEHGSDDPEYLLTDVPLEEALAFVHDYVEADQSDLSVIETEDDILVGDAITDDDINAHGVLDALVPNISLGADDFRAMTGATLRGAGGFIRRHWSELSGVAALAALATSHFYLAGAAGLVGANVRPNIHKKKGLGLEASKKIGSGPHSEGVGGEVETELYVRNETFANLINKRAPDFVQHGLREGDIGKGAVVSAGESLDAFRHAAGVVQYEDDTIPKILQADLDEMSHDELRQLADETDRGYPDEAWDDPEILRQKLYGYAHHEEPETVSWGQAFLDEYGGSIERLEAVLRRGGKDAIDGHTDLKDEALIDREAGDTASNVMGNVSEEIASEEAKRTYARDVADLDEDVEGMVGDAGGPTPDDVDEDFIRGEVPHDEIDPEDFSWSDLRKTKLGISGILLRGLEAEDVVAGAQFLNIDDWLSDQYDRGVRYGSEFVTRNAPDFEEWQERHFGPGKDGGPEEEARRMARFHKEVAAAEDPPDPMEALGISDDRVGAIDDETDALGDYNMASHDSDDTFGNDFDAVAEKFASNEPVAPDHEVEDGHE